MNSNEFYYKSGKNKYEKEKNAYQQTPGTYALSVTCSTFLSPIFIFDSDLFFPLSFLLVVHDLYPGSSKNYTRIIATGIP